MLTKESSNPDGFKTIAIIKGERKMRLRIVEPKQFARVRQ